jgi:hypothetical protein
MIACLCSVVLWSAAGYSQAPAEGRIDLAAILGQPTASTAAGGSCAGSQSGVFFAAHRSRTGSRSGLQKNFCQASCGGDPPVSCSGSGSCSAYDRNCDFGEQGHVTCGTTTYWCPSVCESECQDSPACCSCYETSDCVDCCRCDGHGYGYCEVYCNGW